ncbi:MAG TPA: energy transducer TonB [Thermoanaerobaculia bacterium]|jgi:protein TonB|nr:energy transducer TonB [Thermoanaerobaculia bacterium]
MFETSVVHAQAKAATGRLSLLTISVIAHTSIVIGAVAVSIASVDFPALAPNEYSRAPVFAAIQIPPPLGRPDGGKQPTAQPPQPVKPPVNTQITAPPDTPDDIPVLNTPTTGTGDINNNTGKGTVEGPIGVPWGKEGSIGDLDGPPIVDVPVQQPVEEKIYQPHEVVAPVILHKVEPRYPQMLIKAGVTATVVVRCVIDKNGSVRDAQVVVPASMPPFNTEVLRVVSQWRYKPATYAGRAVDSYLNLTVHFSVKR